MIRPDQQAFYCVEFAGILLTNSRLSTIVLTMISVKERLPTAVHSFSGILISCQSSFNH